LRRPQLASALHPFILSNSLRFQRNPFSQRLSGSSAESTKDRIMKLRRQLILTLAMTTALAACGNETPAPASDSGTQSSGQASASVLNTPIPRDAISTRLELVGQSTYVKGDDSLHVKIRVSNQGKTNLVSAGTSMVRLGAMLLGPNGPDQPPGNRDFMRVDLPLISPGSSTVVEAKLPATSIIGLPVRFDLVQEGVSWFSSYGQPTLDIAPYKRCAGNDKSLCDSHDQAVPSP
jgi:hypothetical protein